MIRTGLRLIFFILTVSASCYAQNVQLPPNEPITLGSLFRLIEEQTEYSIFYNNRYIDPGKTIKGSFGDQADLFGILDNILEEIGLRYELRDKLIIIFPSSGKHLANTTTFVRGRVLDESGQPLTGVTVAVDGILTGFSSDLEGRFSLAAPVGSTVNFSYIGKNSEEYSVKEEQDPILVIMEESSFLLDDIVITGVVANTPRKKLGFTVETLMEELGRGITSSNIAQLISGKISGIKVSGSSYAPGTSMDIQLRGATSIYGGSNPLVILDGVIADNILTDLHAEDIASIEIVKGAASSSLYGSRAANGVIHVITKRGSGLERGASEVVFRTEIGKSFFPFIPRKTESINFEPADDGIDFSNPSPDGIYDSRYPALSNPVGTLFNVGAYITDLISFSSNSADGNTSLYGSLQYTGEKGVVKLVEGLDRLNFRINADHRINDKIKITINNFYSQAKLDNRHKGIWDQFYYSDPDVDLLSPNEENGTPYNVDPNRINPNLPNPLYLINNSIDRESRTRFNSFIGLEYHLYEFLDIRASYGIDRSSGEVFILHPRGLLQAGNDNITVGDIYRGNTGKTGQTIQADGFYHRSFGKLLAKCKLQYLYESEKFVHHSGSGSHLAVTGLGVTSLEQASMDININSVEKMIVAQNFSGVLYLDYDDKYIVDMLLRKDGVSLFGANERWQTFYRLSGAWRMTEDFNIPHVKELKLRASTGVAGLRPVFEAQYEVVGLTNGVITYPVALGNPDLKSSSSIEFETGFDSRIGNRFDLSFSYSRAINKDQILEVPVSAITGFPLQWRNAGRLSSEAFEATLGIGILRTGNTDLNLKIMWDKISQKVVELDGPGYAIVSGGIFRIEEGMEFGTFYGRRFATSVKQVLNQVPAGFDPYEYFTINNEGYVVLGQAIGTVDEEPIQIKDNDGNFVEGKIGSVVPDLSMNLLTSMRYKKINFHYLIGVQVGGQTYNHMRRYMMINGVAKSLDQSEKPSNAVKSVKYYEALSRWNNNHFIEDASFIKLRELSITYDFSIPDPGKAFGIKNANIGLVGRNLLTLTKYTGFDPEAGASQNGLDSNVLKYDIASYPAYSTISCALKLTF